MSENERQLIEAFKKIAEVAGAAVSHSKYPGNGFGEKQGTDEVSRKSEVGCTIKSLPQRLLEKAAKTAVKINPVNAPVIGRITELAPNYVSDPQFLTLLVSKYWGPRPRTLTVSFMENTPTELRNRIIGHMNAWTRTGGISFVETQGTGQVRISRGGSGFWSYLGTDILHIPATRQTMNLGGFTMNTPEREFIRVVRHETGHTLGFPHEHMRKELIERIVPDKAYEYFWENYRWDRQTVDQQVLTPLDERSIMGTPVDQTSIMCYQLPGSITRDGQPIPGGLDINQTDYEFVARIYPKLEHDLMHEHELVHNGRQEWSESEDVQDVPIEPVAV
ncbi:MAG: peptidase M12 [Nostoc sp. GBBB01]|nr:peptidase M12 [Nostoc sp. GBBB01]